MATITKRGNSYRIRASAGYDSQGKQIVYSMTWTPAPGMSEKAIKKELDRQKVLFDEKVKHGHIAAKQAKFETVAREWLKQAALEGNLKPLTLRRFEQTQQRTYDAIGHLLIDSINTHQIQQFINNLTEPGVNQQTGGGLSQKTQKLYLNFISDVFKYAIKCGYTTDNPTKNVSTIRTQKKDRELLTEEQTIDFLRALQTAPTKYRTFFILAIYGGFRRGELLGLEWKDIDFDNNVITINRNSVQGKGGMMTGTPKTKTSCRSLKLPEIVFQQLSEHRAEQDADRAKMGDLWHNTDRIFTTWDGQPMGGDTPRHWLEKFCKENNLPVVNVHSFRHLNATLLISKGTDIKTVSAALGHSQTSTTLDIYAHAFQEQQAKASEAVANALFVGNE